MIAPICRLVRIAVAAIEASLGFWADWLEVGLANHLERRGPGYFQEAAAE
jgi:hypothetical protein